MALIDEYDSIYERIRPFLSLPASEVKRRVNKLIDDQEFWMHQQTFTIRLRNSGRTMTAEGVRRRGAVHCSPPLTTVSQPMRHTNGRPDETMRFLQSIRKWLPDMAIVFTGHDTPWDVVAGEAKEKHNAAAAAQKCEHAALVCSSHACSSDMQTLIQMTTRTTTTTGTSMGGR